MSTAPAQYIEEHKLYDWDVVDYTLICDYCCSGASVTYVHYNNILFNKLKMSNCKNNIIYKINVI